MIRSQARLMNIKLELLSKKKNVIVISEKWQNGKFVNATFYKLKIEGKQIYSNNLGE